MRRRYRKKRKNKKKRIYGRGYSDFKKVFETISLLRNDNFYNKKFFNF